MRYLKMAVAAAVLATACVSVGAVTAPTAVEAKAKAKKDAPGKCGVMKYYDKKTKKCKSKA